MGAFAPPPPYFANHRLSEITIQEVDRYREAKVRERERGLVERPLSNATINKTLTRLAQVLEVAVEYGYLAANPAQGRRRRVKAAQPRRSWLEPEQVKPLLDAVVRGQRGGHTSPDVRTRTLLATAICAGLRIGELLALRWRDVDLARGRIVVGDSKTDAGVRDVDLWPELREELTSFRLSSSRTGPSDLVFGTASGASDSRQNVSKRLKRAAARANEAAEGGIPEDLTLHSLRRTFASLLYLRGEDPPYVMEQLGHTDPKLALRIYARALGDGRRRGRGYRLASVLNGAQWAQTGTNAVVAAVSKDPLHEIVHEKTPR